MQFDASKSVEQNFADLLNLKATFPNFKASHLVLGTPSVITPGAGNGNKNTQIVITPSSEFPQVVTTVQYNRVALTDSRTGIGSKTIINTAATHTAVYDRIRQVHNLEYTGLTQANPPHPPRPGQEQTYRVTSPAGHYVYVPGTRDFTVLNTGSKLEIPSGLKLLIAYPFNDNPLTDVRDHVSNIAVTNSGTVYNTDTTTLARAIRFNGTNSYILVQRELMPNILTGDFTIEMLINLRASQSNQPVISQWKDGSSPEGFSLVVAGTTVQFYFAPGNPSTYLLQGGTLTVSSYVHLAVTREGSTFRIFVNGVQTATTTSSGVNSAGSNLDWMLGKTLATTGLPVGTGTAGSLYVPGSLNADIRELAVWNTAKYSGAFTPPTILI